MIRDVLIIDYNNTQAKDKIIRKGSYIIVSDVIQILQLEDSMPKALQNITYGGKSLRYAKYDKKTEVYI